MAPDFYSNTETSITHLTYNPGSMTYCANYVPYNHVKQETKKERIARIAKERRLASYQLYNRRMDDTKKLVQHCMPQHKHLLKKQVNSCR